MKGFVKTLEAALGTFILLGIVTTVTTEYSSEGTPEEVSNLRSQLESMDTAVIEQAVNERDASVIEDNLNTVTLNQGASIIIWDNYYNSSSESSLSYSFDYGENSSGAEVLVWGDNQQASISLNGDILYSGELSYRRISLQAVDGENNLSINNPSESRLSYLVKHEKRFGENIPDSENVYIVRRAFKQDYTNSSEVNVYLWE